MVKSRHFRVRVLGSEAWGSHLLMRNLGQVVAPSEPQVPPSSPGGCREGFTVRNGHFTDERQTLKEVRNLALPLTVTRWQRQDLNPGPNSKSILLPSESVGLLPSQNQQGTYIFNGLCMWLT